MMSMDVVVCRDGREWDGILEKCDHSLLFHRWDFLKLIEKYSKRKTLGLKSSGRLFPLIVYKGEAPVGLMPLFLFSNRLFSVVVSHPTVSHIMYLGPVFTGWEGMKQSRKESTLLSFHEAVDGFIFKALKASWAFLQMPPYITDSRPFKWSGYDVTPGHNYVIDLGRGLDSVWKNFKKKLRRDINQAVSRGLSVEAGSEEDVGFVYETLAKRRAQDGISMPLPREFLTEAFGLFRDDMNVMVAKKDGKKVGGIVSIFYKDKAILWAGCARSQEGINPNELLIWEIIKLAHEKGLKYCENMDVDTRYLYPFKTKFNGDLTTYLSCKKYSSRGMELIASAYRSMKK